MNSEHAPTKKSQLTRNWQEYLSKKMLLPCRVYIILTFNMAFKRPVQRAAAKFVFKCFYVSKVISKKHFNCTSVCQH